VDLFQSSAVLITLAAAFNYVNYRWLRLPATIGIMAMALALSLVVVLLGVVQPGIRQSAIELLTTIDFTEALMHGMLGLLLFAGALHVDLGDLTAQKGVVATMATVGVLAQTFLVGGAVYLLLPALGVEVAFVHCLLFGSLIAPTDPIAVLGILKRIGAPKNLETTIAGESLFNDGVGVVVFLSLLGIAGLGHHAGHEVGAGVVVQIFVQEALGGAMFGLIGGWVAYRMLKTVDDYQVEILISLALVMGGYALADFLHISGPIAMVVSGLLIGNQGRAFAMSSRTRRHLDTFWELIDEILNAVLFLLIGLELLILDVELAYLVAGLVTIPIALAARMVAVAIPIGLMSIRRTFTPHAVKILTWGGLRGGISVALALWLGKLLGDEHEATRDVLLVMTYAVVVFSIGVQGLTIGKLVGRLGLRSAEAPGPEGPTPDPDAPAGDGAAAPAPGE